MRRGLIWNFLRLNYRRGTWRGVIPFSQADIPDERERSWLDYRALAHEASVIRVSTDPAFIRLIRNETYFDRGMDEWVLTRAVRSLDLTGFDLFRALVQHRAPFHRLHDWELLFHYEDSPSKYFGLVRDVGVHNWLPRDTKKDPTRINVRDYDGGDAVQRLSQLLFTRLKTLG